MKLTDTLIDYLYRAFKKDPERFLAMRIRSENTLTWDVADGVLAVTTSLSSQEFTLENYTLATLASAVATMPGVTVSDIASDSHLSALVLLDSSGNQAESNGDHLYGYGSLLWAYLEPLAMELVEAKAEIVNMLDQMAVTTADNEWLDEWGGYFGIKRNTGETDVVYGNRIIVEIIRPRANNKAIELAIKERFGQSATVTDLRLWGAAIPKYNGAYNYDGSQYHNATSAPIYGLFQVVVGYDLLNGGSQEEFGAEVRALIEKFRDAGTHLDSLSLTTSGMSDSQTSIPADTGASLTVTTNVYHNGAYTHNGVATHAGTAVVAESLP